MNQNTEHKMKTTFITLVLLLAGGMARAQENNGWSRWSVTPHVGLNVSDFAGGDKPSWVKAKVGYGVGVEAEYRFSRWFGLSLGAEWSVMNHKDCQTARITMYDIGSDGTLLKFCEDISSDCISLRYLNVPVLLNVHVWKGLTVRTGVQVGDLIAARMKGTVTQVRSADFNSALSTTYTQLQTVPTDEVAYYMGRHPDEPLSDEGIVNPIWMEGDLNQGVRSQCHRLDIAIPVEVSYEWRGITLGVGYQFGLRDVDGTEDDLYNRNLSIRLGYRINL